MPFAPSTRYSDHSLFPKYFLVGGGSKGFNFPLSQGLFNCNTQTNGWMAFASANCPLARALGVVFAPKSTAEGGPGNFGCEVRFGKFTVRLTAVRSKVLRSDWDRLRRFFVAGRENNTLIRCPKETADLVSRLSINFVLRR